MTTAAEQMLCPMIDIIHLKIESCTLLLVIYDLRSGSCMSLIINYDYFLFKNDLHFDQFRF